MALTTHAEIKAEIMDNLEQLKDSVYPIDLLHELADSNTPIMNNDIIREWQEMPSDYDDGWQQYGMDESFWQGGIVRLMSIDLSLYYQAQFHEIWEEVKEEQEIEND